MSAKTKRSSFVQIDKEKEMNKTVTVKVENLVDAKCMSEDTLASWLLVLNKVEENEKRIEYIADNKEPYLFPSSFLLKFCDITTSIKTKLAFITLLGPRLTDPTSKTEQLLNMFRFAEEKTKVEDILKARQSKITSKQFVSGKGSPAATGRGAGRGTGLSTVSAGRGGRGGRGGLTLGAKSVAGGAVAAPDPESESEPEQMIIETTRPSFQSTPPATEPSRQSRRTSFKDIAERNSIASRRSIVMKAPELPTSPPTTDVMSPPMPPDPAGADKELAAVLEFVELTKDEVVQEVPPTEIWECLAEHDAELDKEATPEVWEQLVDVRRKEEEEEEEEAVAAIVEKLPAMVFEDEQPAPTPELATKVRRHSKFLKAQVAEPVVVPEVVKESRAMSEPVATDCQPQHRGSIRHSTLGVKNVINQFTANKRRSSFLKTVKESFPAVEQRKAAAAPRRVSLKPVGYNLETDLPYYEYDMLVRRNAEKNYEGGLVKSDLEMHLTDDEFVAKFGCAKADFKLLPNWRKTALKKMLLLF